MPNGDETRRTILLVDDFGDSRGLVARMLREEGFEVAEAADGLEAVAAAREARPDLVLMDLGMPAMDGLSATCRLRELPHMRDVPILALTAFGGDTHREAALAVGCDGYLTKPLNPEELLQAVKSHLAAGAGWGGSNGRRRIDSTGMGEEQLLDAIDGILSPRT